MILQALTNYYETLAAKGEIPRDGWAKVNVYYSVDFNNQGEFLRLSPLRETRQVIQKGKKKLIIEPQIKTVPEHMKRSGTNPSPYFLCDNIKYTLGITGGSVNETSLRYNRMFLNHNLMMLDGIDDPVIISFVRLLKKWDPNKAMQNQSVRNYLDEFEDNYNIVFRHESGVFVHDLPVVSELVAQSLGDDKNEQKGVCLVTGKKSSIARIHNSFKGIYSKNPPSNGFTLVGFNMDSVLSFGKTQGYNAPVSKYAAFAYTTTLNYLLADTRHRKFIGDATVVYWAENGESAEQDFMSALFEGGDERITDEVLDDTMKRFAAGQNISVDELTISPSDRFFILALSPNKTRASIRFFYDTTFGDIVENFRRFYNELSIEGSKSCVPLWQILNETAKQDAEGKYNPSPQLAVDMLRTVISGGFYPATLLNEVMQRINADNHEKDLLPIKAAILKAYLLRNSINPSIKEAVKQMELNQSSTYQPYVLGQLFAVLSYIQRTVSFHERHKEVKTIREKYLSSACSSPAVVFPRIIELSDVYLQKADEGFGIKYSNVLNDLFAKLDYRFPSHLTLEEQGSFYIGYYQMNAFLYRKQNRNNEKEEDENA